MEHICVKCNAEMKKARLVSYGGSYVAIEKEHKKLFDANESSIASYVCPKCGYIEYYAEIPEIFK